MSIGNILLGLLLILVGIAWLAWVSIDIKLLGLLSFVTGFVILILSSGINLRQ